MRILILSNEAGGLYKFRREIVENLVTKHEVHVALPYDEFVEEFKSMGCVYENFEFNRRGVNPFADINQVARYIKLIKDIRPDVVLTYTIKPNVYGGIACQIRHTPYIVNITGLGTAVENGGLLGAITTNLYKIGIRKAECVFFQNSSNQKLFVDRRIVKGRTQLIPGSGVDLNEHCMEEYPAEGGEIRFLFIGRIMTDKGINELLQSIQAIHDKYPNIRLDIVGGCDEDYESILNDAAKDGYIYYHGPQKSVHEFIKNTHCTILPSYHEGMANVMLESSSTGRPVITTRVPGCIETFDEGITGFGCDVKNTDSLIESIRKFIELPWNEKRQMGLRGREKMEREYDRSIVIAAYETEVNRINEGR